MNRVEVIQKIHDRYLAVRDSLNERERRLWAASEASRIGYGGISLVSKALHMSPNTVKKGLREIAADDVDMISDADARIRKPGGGRKQKKSASANRQADTESSD